MADPDLELTPMNVNGLRPYADLPVNAPFYEVLINMMPSERRLKRLLEFVYPETFPEITVDAPHPQFHRGDRVYLLTDVDAVYAVDPSALTAAQLTTYNAVNAAATRAITIGTGPWQCAAFLDVFFLTNEGSLVYRTPLAGAGGAPKVTVADTSNANLGVASVANHNNVIVFGGLYGSATSSSDFQDILDTWKSSDFKDAFLTRDDTFDKSWIYYSPPLGGDNQIPGAVFMGPLGIPTSTIYQNFYQEAARSFVENGRMGFFPCRNTGFIRAMKQYENDLIVYGADGVSRLRMTEPGYVETPLSDVGVAGRCAVNGDGTEHVWVSKQGEIYMMGDRAQTYEWAEHKGNGVYRLGYKEFIGAMALNDNFVVSFDSVEHVYWFTDNNATCYLLTRTGLCKSPAVAPFSVMRFPGNSGIVGTGVLVENPEPWEATTHPFEGKKGGDLSEVKHLNLTSQDTATTSTDRVFIEMRAKLRKQDAFTSFTGIYADGRGRCRVDQTGRVFKVKMSGADRTKFDLDEFTAELGRGNPSMGAWI